MAHHAKNPFPATRQITDISGDGPNNNGPLVTTARDRAVAAGIVVNGLAIRPQESETETHGAILDIDLYYQDCVIGGPGAFIVLADGFDAFAEAVRRKFIREIAARPATLVRAGIHFVQSAERPACNIGEWLWFSTPATPQR